MSISFPLRSPHVYDTWGLLLFRAYKDSGQTESAKGHGHCAQLSKRGACTSFPANALGPGLDMEKYILAALVVPKS